MHLYVIVHVAAMEQNSIISLSRPCVRIPNRGPQTVCELAASLGKNIHHIAISGPLPLYETVPRSEQLFDEDNYFPMNHLISYNKFETIGSKVHCLEFGHRATLQLILGNFQS